MADWIWLNEAVSKHQFAWFRKKFSVSEKGTFCFRISAEANFVAFLDGKEFLRGQYPDYPEDKTYTEINLELVAGEHLIAVEVYYCGEDFQTSWYSEQPGLWCELEKHFVSDSSWKCRLSPAHLQIIDKVNPQLGFTVGYDARYEEDFCNPDFDDSKWQNALKVDKNPHLSLRKIPPMARGKYLEGKEIQNGQLYRDLKKYSDCFFAEAVAADQLDVAMGNGFYKIYDLGCERTGLIVLECECIAEGIIIDISHGEHLLDGKVRNVIGTRHFTDRYITRSGRQRYIMPRRIGGRFIQLNITGKESDFKFVRCGIEEEMLELGKTAEFTCDDKQAMQLFENSIRTLRCCMHEHYEDCPWREQALYTYDSRNQIMFGYYLWGNYDYAAYNWELFAKGAREDGYLRLNAPSKAGPPIANFSVVYVTAMLEHYMYSGSKSLYEKLSSSAEKIVSLCTENYDEESGLYLTSSAEGIWHFYEWRDGINGVNDSCTDFSHLSSIPRKEALFNLYMIEMLKALFQLCGDEKYLEIAESQRVALRKNFYDTENKCMLSCPGDKRLHGITQVLAIIHDVVPEEDKKQLLERTVNEEFYSVSISSMRYLLELMMSEGGKFIQAADDLIVRIFGKMLDNGSTTMWETDIGAEDFDGAGSLCHGWSALPVYYYYRYICGIAPVEAGFKKFIIDIVRFEKYGNVAGEITTPYGYINVKYDRNGEKLIVSCPEKLEAIISERTRNSFNNIELQKI
ncbi:MAG: hypothetical protein IKA22_06355 [Lentisphaeria bacterium]|nr:hypothetical protein [Lentisphaeria bacterium]